MSAPLIPSPLDYVGKRQFAFYPAIKNAGPNEWRLGAGDRSEVQVLNVKTGREFWIPRQYIGAVSDAAEAILIVGLRKALDVRAGEVEPRIKSVIEIPRASERDRDRAFFSNPAPGPARVIAIRLESRKKSPVGKAVVGLAIGALLAWLLLGFDWDNCSHSSGLCAATSSR